MKSLNNPYYNLCKCGKIKKSEASMCRKCYLIFNRGKNHWSFGKHLSKEHKLKLKNKLKGRIRSSYEVKAILKGMKNSKHHIYLKENSDDIIKVTQSIHSSIHRSAYRYILEKYGKRGVDNYLKWFNKNIRRLK